MIAKRYRIQRWRAQKLLKKGENGKVGNFIMRYAPNKLTYHRWAIVMSAKFEKLATERNRKRRQTYEAIRENMEEVSNQPQNEHYDIVLIPYKQILSCNYQRIHQNVNDIFKFLSHKKSS